MAGNGQGNGRKDSVGARYEKVDAWERVTGRAEYAADVRVPGALHAKVLRSPHAHAAIISIDASEAEKLPGVKAVITSKDFPPIDELKDSFGGELMVNAQGLEANGPRRGQGAIRRARRGGGGGNDPGHRRGGAGSDQS